MSLLLHELYLGRHVNLPPRGRVLGSRAESGQEMKELEWKSRHKGI